MSATLDAPLWPLALRDQVAPALARAAGLARPAAPEWFQLTHDALATSGPWSERAPAFFQIEATPDGPAGWLAVLAREGATARVLAPDGGTARVPAEAIARLLRASAEARVSAGVDGVLARAGLALARAPAIRDALVSAALAGEPVVEGWRVRARAGSLASVLREAGVARRLVLTALAYGAQLALLVLAWWMVGARAAAGRAGPSGVAAWIGVLAAFVAAHAAASWSAGRLAVDGGRLLRARLMEGLLALDTEPLRAEGIGQLLGRVMETEAVESLSLGGGLLGVAGLFELTTGAIILALGVSASSELAYLGLLFTVAGVLATWLWRALGRWSALRLALTHDLVERMVGHRTLVAQQPPELRHAGEDAALAAYEDAGRTLDRVAAALGVLVPRGWLFVGVATLAPGLATSSVGPGLVATTLGGVLFVHGALRKLTQAFPALATAAVAWRQVAPLFAGSADVAPAPARGNAPPSPRATMPRQSRSTPPRLRSNLPRRPRSSSRARSAFATPSARRPRSPAARSRSAAAIASCSRARRAAANRRSPRSSRACARPTSARSRSTASTSPTSASSAGASAWASCRSSTRTTCSRRACSSTCCWAAPGPRAARTSPPPKRSAETSISAASSVECPQGSSSSSARAAGSSPTESAAASSSRARSFSGSTCASSTRASRRSTRKLSSACSSVSLLAPTRCS